MFQSDKELPVVEAPTKHFCLPRWRATVGAAKARGGFSVDEMWEARHWDQCACGEARELYSIEYRLSDYRDNVMLPADTRLRLLGGEFAVQVNHNWFDACLVTLGKIEQRLEELDAG